MWGDHTPFSCESLACKTTSAFPAVSHGTICHFNMVNTWTRHMSTNTSISLCQLDIQRATWLAELLDSVSGIVFCSPIFVCAASLPLGRLEHCLSIIKYVYSQTKVSLTHKFTSFLLYHSVFLLPLQATNSFGIVCSPTNLNFFHSAHTDGMQEDFVKLFCIIELAASR